MEYRASRRVRTGIYGSALAVGLIASMGLLGHFLGLPALAGRVGTFRAMVPATGICLLVVALAIAVRVLAPSRLRLLTHLAGAVLGVAALEIADFLTGLPVAFDRLFAPAEQMMVGGQDGRMSPIVALSLAALAVAVLLSYSRDPRRRTLSQSLGLVVGNSGFVLCVGYAFGTPLLADIAPWPPALPAALSLTLLGLSSALLTADRRPLSLFVGGSVKAQLLRTVMPVVIGTALAFAGLDAAHHLLGIEQSPMLASGMVIAGVVVASYLTVRVASRIGGRIDAADAAREEALVQLEHGNERLERMVRDVATSMGRAVEARDPYTQGHERRVAALARRLAEEMGLAHEQLEGIEMAALLHDVGKLCVPAEILAKPGRLSAVEFGLIRQHSQAGYDILKGIDFPWDIAQIVLQHHERLDGSGYPFGLIDGEILTEARVLSVADVVEAMASHRPYRPGLGIQAALDEILGHPERYDAEVAAALERLNERGELGLL